jgi:hypothetical protein
MPAVTAWPIARFAVAAVACLMLIGGAAATGAGRPAPPAPRAALIHPVSLAPRGAAARLLPAQALRAAQSCAAYAGAAGFANNGQYGGDLVIAVAVCVAESGGTPSIYYCEGSGLVAYYPPVNCASGSYDRGLWQINSQSHPEVTDACAFSPQCNATAAYQISDQGTDFAPWAVYDSDLYARYLGAAQAAVSGLAAGTVTGALFGVCAVPAQRAAGAAVTVGRCGRRGAAQRWTVTGGTVRQGALCLAAVSGAGPTVAVSTCSGGPSQAWTATSAGQLRASSGRCLDDPRGSGAAGTALRLASCRVARRQTWWLP